MTDQLDSAQFDQKDVKHDARTGRHAVKILQIKHTSRRQVKLHHLSVSGAYPGSGLSNNPRRENEYVFSTELELGMCEMQV